MSSPVKLFVLTGAGISAESGIPVFQGTNWRGHSHYELANIDTWQRDPRIVWEYYSERRSRARDAKPSLAHKALAEFESRGSYVRFFICTQNVDGLHEEAGSKNVLHIHGKLFESRCANDCSQAVFPDYAGYTPQQLPQCSCGALVRPNVCWFGEQPFDLNRVYQELELCNIFVAIGTSGSVQPVASFAGVLKRRPNPTTTIYIGLDRPANAYYFDQVHIGMASNLVPLVLSKLNLAL
ncbi:MAG TPA: Sir2 family NAD-dependent protein deacetylase [Candidatus Angelobacter sp.]